MLKYKKIKKDDTVKVIAGKDLGKTGKVLEINRNKGKVLVEGVNIVNIYSFILTDIKETKQDGNLPNNIGSLTCYPNPFNSSTLIQYSNLKGGVIGIYDITGSLVKTLS